MTGYCMRCGIPHTTPCKRPITDIAGGEMSDNSPLSDIRDRIAAVIVQHHTDCDDAADGTSTQCECDARWRRAGEWAQHVADAVIAELGLRECDDMDCRCRHTAVTDWKADDE